MTEPKQNDREPVLGMGGRCRLGVRLTIPLLLFVAAPAHAQEKTSKNDERLVRFLERFPDADANRDGVLTMTEARAYRAQRGGGRPHQKGKGAARQRQHKIPPTHANVKYGPHERNVIDFWKGKSDKPTPVFVFFHGGGFRAGDKSRYNQAFLASCMESGISFAAANYRLSQHAEYPAQMHDSARAIQYLRHKAGEWSIDPTRIAAHGGSAGSGISLWLAFHDDMADPQSQDPVARQSTRLSCAVAMQMQSTYDPCEIKKVVPGRAYNHVALKLLFGLTTDWDWDSAEVGETLSARLKDASPITHLTKDDPPAFLYHRKSQEKPGNIHHPNFGRHLKKAMDSLSIQCVHRMDSDYENSAAAYKDMVEFVKKQFGME